MAIPQDPRRTDYPPYPVQELAFPISSVKVEAVSAIHHVCRSTWRIKPRTVPDDMLFYFVSGRAVFKVGGREFSAKAGDCLHLPRNVVQSASADAGDPPSVIVIHYHARTFGSLHLAVLVGLPARMKVADRDWMTALADEACREYLHRPLGWREGLNAKVWQILLYLIRYHGPEGRLSYSTEDWRSLARLQPALQKMDETLAEPGTMSALARCCGCSEAQFRRVFRRAIGQSPVAYLRTRRMEEACLLLRETDLKVEDIAARVGYAEPGYFWSTFRKLVGQTPSSYRKLALLDRI